MKRATLTPERKAVREAQESKWFNGYAGAATSWPYRVKRYLSKEFSDKIHAEVQAKCDEWIAKLKSVKPSQRFDNVCKHNWCGELIPQWICIDNNEENAIPTQVLGHKIYVKILDSYCKKNGQYGIKPMERPVLEISRYFNSPHDGDWHNIGEQLNFEIRWDDSKQLYYVCEYRRASTGKTEITRKNWGRTAKRKEFMAEVEKLENSLTESGVTIGSLVSTDSVYSWYVCGLEKKFVNCEGPEVAA